MYWRNIYIVCLLYYYYDTHKRKHGDWVVGDIKGNTKITWFNCTRIEEGVRTMSLLKTLISIGDSTYKIWKEFVGIFVALLVSILLQEIGWYAASIILMFVIILSWAAHVQYEIDFQEEQKELLKSIKGEQ